MKSKDQTKNQKVWVVAVDMGYGHQRAADPLRQIAYGGQIINANNYSGIPKKDRDMWEGSRKGYEFISRFKNFPIIGNTAFNLFDDLQEIPTFYPKRDLSRPSLQVLYLMMMIKQKKWGQHLINKLARKKLPLITTFFTVAFMAEHFDYPGEIYLVATDTDISRAWVSIDPKKSRIRYFAPSTRVVERLKDYGVAEDKIFLTGFPLPTELLGNEKLDTLRADLAKRLVNLDPNREYINRYEDSIMHHLGQKNLPKTKSDHILTVMFAVGGAGAQREVGVAIIKSLIAQIQNKKIRVILVAGTHKDIKKYFNEEVAKLGLEKEVGTGIKILHSLNKEGYFRDFNKALRKTDILWTKPIELSFYTALGLPIIMSDPVGSQEKFNRHWLLMIGSGIEQDDPRYANEWLFDLINTGWLAEGAMKGFLEAPKFGTYNIEKVINYKEDEILKSRTEMQY